MWLTSVKGLIKGNGNFDNLKLSTGSILGMLIPALLGPILARCYSVTDFGFYTIYFSIVTFGAKFGALRLEIAIPVVDEDDLKDLGDLINLLPIAMATLTIVLSLFIFPNMINPQPQLYLLVITLSLLTGIGAYVATTLVVGTNFALRNRNFNRISASRATQGISMGVCQVTFGVMGLGWIGLVVGELVSKLSSIAILPKWNVKPHIIPIKNILLILKKHESFYLLGGAATLINSLSLLAPNFLFAFFNNKDIVGQYGMVTRIIFIPETIFCAALAQVTIGKLRLLQTQNEKKALFNSNLINSMFLAIPVLITTMFWGEPLFSMILGSRWRMAGEFAQILSPWVFFVAIAGPLAPIVVFLGKQRQELIFQIMLFLCRISALGLGWFGYSDRAVIIAFSVMSAIPWFCYTLWLLVIWNRWFSQSQEL